MEKFYLVREAHKTADARLRPVIVCGKVYPSIAEAAESEKISYANAVYRIRNNRKGWAYCASAAMDPTVMEKVMSATNADKDAMKAKVDELAAKLDAMEAELSKERNAHELANERVEYLLSQNNKLTDICHEKELRLSKVQSALQEILS